MPQAPHHTFCGTHALATIRLGLGHALFVPFMPTSSTSLPLSCPVTLPPPSPLPSVCVLVSRMNVCVVMCVWHGRWGKETPLQGIFGIHKVRILWGLICGCWRSSIYKWEIKMSTKTLPQTPCPKLWHTLPLDERVGRRGEASGA